MADVANRVFISVVIPTFNRAESLRRTLAALATQSYPAQRYEVIVVIDGSTDETRDMLGQVAMPFGLRVFASENKGQGAARNTGIWQAHGEVILFLDDDSVASPGLLEEHAQYHGEAPDLVVIGPILLHPESPLSPALAAVRREHDEFIERVATTGHLQLPGDAVLNANTSVRLTHLQAVRGYDERLYRQREDAELGYRLLKYGLRYRYAPHALAYHYYTKTDEEIINDTYWAGYNDVLRLRQHPSSRTISPLNVLFFGGSTLKRPLKRLVWSYPEAARSLLRAFSRALRRVCRDSGPSFVPRILFRSGQFSEYCRGVRAAGGRLSELRRMLRRRIPILMYHNVGPAEPGAFAELTVGSEQFASQMRILSDEGYTTVTLDDWMNWREHGAPLPAKPVILTFDDGYCGVYKHAFPTLQAHRFRATVFLVSDLIGKTNAWDQAKGSGPLQLLTISQIREMMRYGFNFQSHSRTHASLPSLRWSQALEQIEGSKRVLEDMLGQRVHFFAYPFGHMDDTLRERMRATGYRGACSSLDGFSDESDDQYGLKRIMVSGNAPMRAFRLKLTFGRDVEARFRSRVSARVRTGAHWLTGA